MGSDLPDMEAVREEAVKRARELIADDLRLSRLEDRTFWVRDESGETVLTLAFRELSS